jgi:hypothetical protein
MIFNDLRTKTREAADRSPLSTDHRGDWIALNKVLGDERDTIVWFDTIKVDSDAAVMLDRLSPLLLEPLKSRGRWADIGRLYRDPLDELARQHATMTSRLASSSDDVDARSLANNRVVAFERFRAAATTIFAALLAAGRSTEAKALLEEASRLDPSDAMRQALAGIVIRHN